MSACEHYQQQISQLLDGELPPEQVQTLRAHLRTCPECQRVYDLSLIHISEPTRLGMISYAVFCLKKKKK